MKKVFLLLSFVFFSSVPSGYGSIHSKQTEHYKTIFYQIHTFMQKASINRDITWNDELSRELENKFFDFFDPDQLVFDSDYREKMLREYGECLDDYISLGRYDLVKKNFDILKFYAHSQLKESESEMLSFFLTASDDEISSLENQEKKWMTFFANILKKNKISSQSPEAESVLTGEIQKLGQRILDLSEEEIFKQIVNYYLQAYDPHSNYLGRSDLVAMMKSVRKGPVAGVGLQIENRGEEVYIAGIVPGSSASKNTFLKSGQKILAIGKDPETLVDLQGKNVADLHELMSVNVGDSIYMSVYDNAGQTQAKVIRLETTLYEKDPNRIFAYDYINDFNGSDVRYKVLKIPSFYRSNKSVNEYYRSVTEEKKSEKRSLKDFGKLQKKEPPSYEDLSKKYFSLTLDVAAEIEKMKKSSLSYEGLIIDLRGNIGGDLAEAINLAGLFLSNEIVVKEKTVGNEDPNIFQTLDREIFYKGPLMVLVDHSSASSSEIFAGAIQDYARGLVVGEKSFGKGTAQHRKMFGSGMLSYTTSQLYRASNKSTQLRGVTPDLALSFLESDQKIKKYREKTLYKKPIQYNEIGEVDPLYPYLQIKRIIPLLKNRSKNRQDSYHLSSEEYNENFLTEAAAIFSDAIYLEGNQMSVSGNLNLLQIRLVQFIKDTLNK